MSETSVNFAPAVIVAQVAVAALGMAAFVLGPRGDQPAMLYPIDAKAAQILPQIISRPGTLILARGQLDGSYIIDGNRPGFSESLMASGILVLNASAPGCGPVETAAQGSTQA